MYLLDELKETIFQFELHMNRSDTEMMYELLACFFEDQGPIVRNTTMEGLCFKLNQLSKEFDFADEYVVTYLEPYDR